MDKAAFTLTEYPSIPSYIQLDPNPPANTSTAISPYKSKVDPHINNDNTNNNNPSEIQSLGCFGDDDEILLNDDHSSNPTTAVVKESLSSMAKLLLLPTFCRDFDYDLRRAKSCGVLPRRGSDVSQNSTHSSLSVQQCGSKEETRQRKFSTVASRWMRAKNVRNVLSFFKKKSTADITAPLPSKEAVELWAQSFSALLADKYGLSLFKDFLCSEYSEENVEFWIACQEYRQLKLKQQASRAQTIYSNFITVHAPREVNLDSKTRLETMKSLNDPDKSTFDLAQAKIQCLMEKDSYPRFLRSTFYTDIVTKINIS